jgi:hypothetical protein
MELASLPVVHLYERRAADDLFDAAAGGPGGSVRVLPRPPLAEGDVDPF